MEPSEAGDRRKTDGGGCGDDGTGTRAPVLSGAVVDASGASDPGREAVEVVDLDGTVIDVVSRATMRAGHLRHRCTYVAVIAGPTGTLGTGTGPAALSADTPVIVHQRADWKDTYPSYWDLAFGGVCAVGESWESSAERELAEEAGIAGAVLHDLGPSAFEDESNRIVGRVYVAAWPEDPVCVDGEVVAIDRIPLGELSRWAQGREVCPDSAEVVLPRLLELLR